MSAAPEIHPDPFALASEYRSAGWIGTLPIPLGAKWPPPKGYTGEDGTWPSGADVAAWTEEGPRNIALRLPPNVVALDVDVDAAFADLLTRVGPLPPTWRAHSGSGRLGHLYFRLPAGVTSHGWQAPGEGVDLLRYGHRYSVVWPSLHPSGSRYAWAPPGPPAPEAMRMRIFPRPGDLPELPEAWIRHLSGEARVGAISGAAPGSGDWWSQFSGGAPGLGTPITHNHDDALAAYAFGLAQRGTLDFEEIVALTVRRGADCDPPWGRRPGDQSLEEAARTRWVPGAMRKAEKEAQWALEAAEEAEAGLEIVDWHKVWSLPEEDDWLVPGLVPARRGVALYSAPKVGKSLLVLEMAVAVSQGATFLGEACEAATVLYVDHENDLRGDVRSRLRGMGYGPDDLTGLRYLSMPLMGPLDSAAGAAELLEVAQREGAALVVLDTVSRTVAGEENANDTWLAFYRHTGRALKAAGIAYLRLDHSGKDDERGMRGGSAKSGDVDLVWRMTKKDEDEFVLTCDAHRLPVPQKAIFVHRAVSPRLTHVISTRTQNEELRKAGAFYALILERWSADALPGYRTVAAALREAGHEVADATVKELVRNLKRRAQFERDVALRVEGGTE